MLTHSFRKKFIVPLLGLFFQSLPLDAMELAKTRLAERDKPIYGHNKKGWNPLQVAAYHGNSGKIEYWTAQEWTYRYELTPEGLKFDDILRDEPPDNLPAGSLESNARRESNKLRRVLRLGMDHYLGRNRVLKSCEKAKTCFEQVAFQNDDPILRLKAWVLLGSFFATDTGQHSGVSYQECAQKICNEAAQSSDKIVQARAWLYLGKEEYLNNGTSLQHLLLAASQENDPEVQAKAALVLAQRWLEFDKRLSDEQVLIFLERAARQTIYSKGWIKASYELADIYTNIPNLIDLNKARLHLERLEAQNYSEYYRERALIKLAKLTEFSQAIDNFLLGEKFARGLGVSVDKKLAQEFYKTAADQSSNPPIRAKASYYYAKNSDDGMLKQEYFGRATQGVDIGIRAKALMKSLEVTHFESLNMRSSLMWKFMGYENQKRIGLDTQQHIRRRYEIVTSQSDNLKAQARACLAYALFLLAYESNSDHEKIAQCLQKAAGQTVDMSVRVGAEFCLLFFEGRGQTSAGIENFEKFLLQNSNLFVRALSFFFLGCTHSQGEIVPRHEPKSIMYFKQCEDCKFSFHKGMDSLVGFLLYGYVMKEYLNRKPNNILGADYLNQWDGTQCLLSSARLQYSMARALVHQILSSAFKDAADALLTDLAKKAEVTGSCLEKEVDEEFVVLSNSLKNPAIIFIAVEEGHEEVIEILVRKSFYLGGQREDGKTPLHLAAQKGLAKIVKFLIQGGVEIHEVDRGGCTALHYALNGGHTAVACLLIRPITVNQQDKRGLQPLHYAAARNDLASIRQLVESGAKCERLPLIDGFSPPLHVTLQASYDNDLVQKLIDAGADIHERNRDGSTPLHCAAMRTNTSAAKMLIDLGARINAQNKLGYTPLHCVSIAEGDDDSLIDMLIAAGAAINERDKQGSTALHHAAAKGNIKVVKALLNAKADVNIQNNVGRAPLHYALAGEGNLQIAELLLKQDVHVNAQDRKGVTPLHQLVLLESFSQNKDAIKILMMLFKMGARLDSVKELLLSKGRKSLIVPELLIILQILGKALYKR